MKIEIKGQALRLQELEVKKGNNAGKKFNVLHFYDNEELHKLSIPEKDKEKVELFVGSECTLEASLDVANKKMYFIDLK